MDQRQLGDLTTTVLGFGCWPIAGYVHDLDDGQPERTIHAALDAGIRLFDTARAHCHELGITYLPYSPFGGPGAASQLGERHPALTSVAEQHGVSPHQVCLARLRSLDEVVLPIPAATRPATIRDSAAAADLDLTEQDLADLADLG